jgi:non-canonical poly(A) RNA polymerase PAPD5/7
MSTAPNAFQAGHDYISFDAPSPPANTAAAGPSRLQDATALSANGSVKGKERAREGLNAEDDRLLAAKNGRRDAGASSQGNGDVRGKGQGKGKGKGKGKDKGKGKESATRGQAGSKRSMEEDTGPRNLKEERKAAERHAPWADLVDWEGCHDPAEM